ncbi:MAG: hypothetical protein IJ756_09380 [Paludibacteraceae bacterium]|nr:hypothetical protein [Paludibacteraceae bacterium]
MIYTRTKRRSAAGVLCSVVKQPNISNRISVGFIVVCFCGWHCEGLV